VSKLGDANLIFIESGAKINRQYNQKVILMQELLLVICSIAGDVFVFQQGNPTTHSSHDMVKFLCHEMPH